MEVIKMVPEHVLEMYRADRAEYVKAHPSSENLSSDEVVDLTSCPCDSCDANTGAPCVDRLGVPLLVPHAARRAMAASIDADLRNAGVLPEHDDAAYRILWPEGAKRLDRQRAAIRAAASRKAARDAR
jgi:hypothetical protein